MIKYIENSRESNATKTLMVNYPLSPITEKNSGGIILYQTNAPECEPHFDIFHEDNLIDCIGGRENFFYAITIFLYFMKFKKSSLAMQLSIDEMIDAVIKF